eukprot:TRINITY_DN9290_c0_g1_i18.p1 TRINITY_DN9290_c0_g1~~TRINITY_DN9290_c0_g1_i18.p1  ORF type:complete len:498 (+),score=115.53 TRINITY_DN9290_c0_g1_i18:192-1685(+)
MQRGVTTNCKAHGQKARKLCKNPECWVRICPKCANTSHKGHEVAEWSQIVQEANAAKDKLLQVKKGDLITIKRILDGMGNLDAQLNELQEKRREDARRVQTSVLSRIAKTSEETELEYSSLKTRLADGQKDVDGLYKSLLQEISKLPVLANAVISKGTADDLRTFFEMCKKGSEVNGEIFDQKQSVDELKQSIEDFSAINPLAFSFAFDKSFTEEPTSSNIFSTQNLSLHEDRELNKTLSLGFPLKTPEESFANGAKEDSGKKTMHRVNSSVEMSNRRNKINTSFTAPAKEKSLPKSSVSKRNTQMHKKCNSTNQSFAQLNKNRSYSNIQSKYNTLRTENQRAQSKKPGINSKAVSTSDTSSAVHNRKPSLIPKLKTVLTQPKNERGKSGAFLKLATQTAPVITEQQLLIAKQLSAAKITINELKASFSSMAEVIASNLCSFADMSSVIKEIIEFLKDSKGDDKRESLKNFASKVLECAAKSNIKQHKELCTSWFNL